MTKESNNNENVEDQSEQPGKLLLDFDFTPDWARKSASEITFNESKSGGSSDNKRRPSAKRNDRRPPRTTGRFGPNRSPDRNIGEQKASDGKFRRSDSPVRNRPYIEMPPVQVRFLPEQNKLSAIARKIHSTKQAYPLAELAMLVLSSPDSCYVKIESGHKEDAVPLYQCKQCRAVGLNREEMLAHVADMHIDDFFDKESIEVSAPSGVFTCVAKCGLSGTILGPPNHHSYNQRVKEIHDAKYPNMSFEEYRQKIITVKDEETIEKWKEESTHQVTYSLKVQETKKVEKPVLVPVEAPVDDTPSETPDEAVAEVSATEPEENKAETMDRNAACKYCATEIAPKLIVRTKVASLPLNVARNLKDPGLELVCRAGWRRENKFPRSLLLALRAALKHMQLYIFKVGASEFFVTSVQPLPLDPQYTVAEIAEVLNFIKDNPNCKRIDLISGLRPDHAVDSKEAEKVFTQLHWLIERGHIIEFYNGCLFVSEQRQSGSPKPDSRGRKSGDQRSGGKGRKTKAEKKTESEKKPVAKKADVAESKTEKADTEEVK